MYLSWGKFLQFSDHTHSENADFYCINMTLYLAIIMVHRQGGKIKSLEFLHILW